jgi:hypothetical protein
MSDRYMKIILTVIALELLWIGVKDIGTPASAQAPTAQQQAAASQQVAPLPVVIRGIDIINPAANADVARSALPVYARASVPVYSSQTLKVDADRPLAIVGAAPLKIEADKPLPVEAPAGKPLRVEIPRTVGLTPGE